MNKKEMNMATSMAQKLVNCGIPIDKAVDVVCGAYGLRGQESVVKSEVISSVPKKKIMNK